MGIYIAKYIAQTIDNIRIMCYLCIENAGGPWLHLIEVIPLLVLLFDLLTHEKR